MVRAHGGGGGGGGDLQDESKAVGSAGRLFVVRARRGGSDPEREVGFKASDDCQRPAGGGKIGCEALGWGCVELYSDVVRCNVV